MTTAYLCPHCRANLNPKNDIVLRASAEGGSGLIILSPQPGNYEVVASPGLNLAPRAMVGLACPVCNHDLASPNDPEMAEMLFDGGDLSGVVRFSRRYGHHATYFISDRDVRTYGEHADAQGVNHWGVGPGR